MPKAVIQANIQTANGTVSVAPGASVEIRNADSGSLVSLWEDRDGTTPTDNPTTADSSGRFRVYADAGQRVNIIAVSDGLTARWDDVDLVALGSESNQVPTNAEFGGPTPEQIGRGAIVESGTNANGSYVRWENGEQVCWAPVDIDWETEDNQSFSFPAAFDGDPAVSFSARSGTNPAYNNAVQGVAIKYFFEQAWNVQLTVTSSTFNNPAKVFAWGFWK